MVPVRRRLAVVIGVVALVVASCGGGGDGSAVASDDSGGPGTTAAGGGEASGAEGQDDGSRADEASGERMAVIAIDGDAMTYDLDDITFSSVEGVADLTFETCSPDFFSSGRFYAIGYAVDDEGEVLVGEDGQPAGTFSMDLPPDDWEATQRDAPTFDLKVYGLDLRIATPEEAEGETSAITRNPGFPTAYTTSATQGSRTRTRGPQPRVPDRVYDVCNPGFPTAYTTSATQGSKGSPTSVPSWSGARRHSELGSPDQGAAQSQLVGIVEVSPHGQTRGEPGHPQTQWLELPGDVHRRGVTLDRRVCGHDQLLDTLGLEAEPQLVEAELTRADAVDRGE